MRTLAVRGVNGMKKVETIIRSKRGCMWATKWELVLDCPCSDFSGHICKHCFHKRKEPLHKPGDFKYTWLCPMVLVTYTDGGCVSTGLCVQCINEITSQIMPCCTKLAQH